jgi:hypothetical protein
MVLENLGMGGASTEVARVLGKSKDSAANAAYNRDFNTDNWDSFGGDTQSGKFIEVARFKVPASTEYSFGYGSEDNPENQGYLYVDLQGGSSNEIEGTIQLVQESATGRQKVVVAEYDTNRLDSSKSDRTQMVPLPEQVDKPTVGQDSYLVLYFDGNSGGNTIDSTNSESIIPVTEYDLSQ